MNFLSSFLSLLFLHPGHIPEINHSQTKDLDVRSDLNSIVNIEPGIIFTLFHPSNLLQEMLKTPPPKMSFSAAPPSWVCWDSLFGSSRKPVKYQDSCLSFRCDHVKDMHTHACTCPCTGWTFLFILKPGLHRQTLHPPSNLPPIVPFGRESEKWPDPPNAAPWILHREEGGAIVRELQLVTFPSCSPFKSLSHLPCEFPFFGGVFHKEFFWAALLSF